MTSEAPHAGSGGSFDPYDHLLPPSSSFDPYAGIGGSDASGEGSPSGSSAEIRKHRGKLAASYNMYLRSQQGGTYKSFRNWVLDGLTAPLRSTTLDVYKGPAVFLPVLTDVQAVKNVLVLDPRDPVAITIEVDDLMSG